MNECLKEKKKKFVREQRNIVLEECYKELRVKFISGVMALNYSEAVLLKSGSNHRVS
jgi:hypothetical protein